MARRFLTNIDMGKNEIQNVVIHKLATAPGSPADGQIYYNTSDNRYYLYNGTLWKDVTGRLDNILSGTTALTVADNGDGTLTISIANANSSNAGLMSTGHYDDLTNATDAATPDTLVKRDANGDASFNEISIASGTVTNAPVNPTDIVNKGYVDNLVASGVNIVGTIDCSTNPDYPSAAGAGEAYHVSVAGRIGGGSGPLVEVGDLIVAVAASAGGDHATVGSDWIIMQTNVDAATETTAGIIRIATTAEVNAGTNDETAVTPSKMAAYVASLISGGKYAADVGDGVATAISVSHALGSSDVIVQVRDTTTLEVVEPDISITDANTVTLGFTNAPASNAFRVTIQA